MVCAGDSSFGSSRDGAILRIVGAAALCFLGRPSKTRPFLPGSRKHVDDPAWRWISSILQCVRGRREEVLGFFLVRDGFDNHLLLARHWNYCFG